MFFISILNHSKTEQFALKSVQASEWLDTLFFCSGIT